MKCIRCGVAIVSRHNPLYTTHEPEFCSDACENGEPEGLDEFMNRLRILRSLDGLEVPHVASWPEFRDDPYEYLISCPDDEAEHIWTALRKREND